MYIFTVFFPTCARSHFELITKARSTLLIRVFLLLFIRTNKYIFFSLLPTFVVFSALFTGFLLFLSTMHQNTSTKKQVKTLFPVELRSCKIKLLNGCLKVIALNYAAFPSLNYSGFMLLITLL